MANLTSQFLAVDTYEVELEKDLLLKQQFLDVVINKKSNEVEIYDICDELENLRDYNLMTYKSLHKSLTP